MLKRLLFYILYCCLAFAGGYIIDRFPWDGEYKIYCFFAFLFILLSTFSGAFVRAGVWPRVMSTIVIWGISSYAGLYVMVQLIFASFIASSAPPILLYGTIYSCGTMIVCYELYILGRRGVVYLKTRQPL